MEKFENTQIFVGELAQSRQMITRFLAVVFGLAQDVDVNPGAGRQELAGDDEAVATVIAFAAQDDHVLTAPAANEGITLFDDGVAGIFHEDCRGNGVDTVHSRLIHVPHLGGCVKFLHVLPLFSLSL